MTSPQVQSAEKAIANIIRSRIATRPGHLAVPVGELGLEDFVLAVMPDFHVCEFHRFVFRHLEALERGDITRLMLFLPPRHGKTVAVDTPVLMGDGNYKRLGDIGVGDTVITHVGHPKPVVAVHEQGLLPALTITTESGRRVTAALDHPFLTPEGWRQAQHLEIGDVLALVSAPRCRAANFERSEEEFRLAGYLIGDGNVSATGNSCHASFFNYDPDIRPDFERCLTALGFAFIRRPNNGVADAKVAMSGGIRPWLRRSELFGKGAWTKRVPSWVYLGSPHEIAAFLGAYFVCDGSLNQRGGARSDLAVSFYSVSKDLLDDVQHLLLRLGIRSRVSKKVATNINFVEGPHTSYRLTITSQDDTARFIAAIPLVGAKAQKLAQWNIKRSEFERPLLSDRIVAIERAGEVECRCLTVADDHTFTANDIVVHNTLMASILFPIWFAARHAKKQIIVTSNSAEFAQKEISQVAQTFTHAPGWPFPDVRIDRKTRSIKNWRMTNNTVYRAIGLDGQITGRGSDLLVIDDVLKSRADAESIVIRERQWSVYTSALHARGELGNRIVFCNTRFHDDDLAGRLLNAMEHGGDQWTVLRLPAEAEEDDLMGRAVGDVICPHRWPKDALYLKRYVDPEESGERNWATLYQQRPVPAEGNMFKYEWFSQTYDSEPLGLFRFISVDGAYKEGIDTDFSVVQVWGIKKQEMYILHQWRGRVEFPELLKQVERVSTLYNTNTILIEDSASGQSAIQVLRRIPKYRIVKVNARGSKVSRAEATTNFWETGKVWVPRAAPWLSQFIDEHLRFPAGKHDDAVDASSQAIRWGTKGYAHVDRYRSLRVTTTSAQAIARDEQPDSVDDASESFIALKAVLQARQPVETTRDQWHAAVRHTLEQVSRRLSEEGDAAGSLYAVNEMRRIDALYGSGIKSKDVGRLRIGDAKWTRSN